MLIRPSESSAASASTPAATPTSSCSILRGNARPPPRWSILPARFRGRSSSTISVALRSSSRPPRTTESASSGGRDHAGETKRRSRAGLTGNPLIQARIQIVFVRFDNERSIPPTHLSDSSPLSLGYTAFPCSSQLSDSIAQIGYLTSELEIRR